MQRGDTSLREETRGTIEAAIDGMHFELGNLEAVQEVTPIQNVEEFLLGIAVGYLRRYSEVVVLLESTEKKTLTHEDQKEISKMLLRRIPEIRKQIVKYLNK
jgi:hypothetical protein